MNTPGPIDPNDERRLRAALSAAAADVTPSADALARIRRRTDRPPLWRRPLVVATAALAAAGVAVAIAVLPGGSGEVTVVPAGSPSGRQVEPTPPAESPAGSPPVSSPVSPPEATETPDTPVLALTVPVYFATTTTAGDRLAREFHRVESSAGAVSAALGEMFAGADDPDYTSLWAASARVVDAEIGAASIDVRIEAPEGVGAVSAETANLAVQQLVYTATAAAASAGGDGSLPLRLRVDDLGPGDALNQVDLSEPIARADPLSVRQLVQVNNPAENSTAGSPVTVDGEAAAFEATIVWEIRSEGAVVDSGFTTADECCRFAPFRFEVDLEPGSYEIAVSETDPSGGEGRPPMTDTKSFTVSSE